MSKVDLRTRVLHLLISIAIGYVALLILVRLFESRLIFFPNYPGRLSGEWNPRGLPIQDIWLTASDGTKLHAWWIPNDKARFTFLAFHGNAGNITDRASIYAFLNGIPANVLAVEYRGYGRSEGKPGEAGFYRDADSAYDFLVDSKHIDSKSIISFGQSLGTAMAAHLAAARPVAASIVEAPFPSAEKVATTMFRFLPGLSFLVHGQFDTEARLKEIHVPVFIVHCTQDPVLPFVFGREVYAASQPPKTFLEINGYCHEEASVIAPEKYRATLRNFLSGTYDHR